MTLIDRLEKMEKKATPGPWSMTFEEEAFGFLSVNRDLDDITNDDFNLIDALRNAAPQLIALVKAVKAYTDPSMPIVIPEKWDSMVSALAALEEMK